MYRPCMQFEYTATSNLEQLPYEYEGTTSLPESVHHDLQYLTNLEDFNKRK
jgi:hypothetical protein